VPLELGLLGCADSASARVVAVNHQPSGHIETMDCRLRRGSGQRGYLPAPGDLINRQRECLEAALADDSLVGL